MTEARRAGAIDALVCAGCAIALGWWAAWPPGWCVLVGAVGSFGGVLGSRMGSGGGRPPRAALVVGVVGCAVAVVVVPLHVPGELPEGFAHRAAGGEPVWVTGDGIAWRVRWGAVVERTGRLGASSGLHWVSADGRRAVRWAPRPGFRGPPALLVGPVEGAHRWELPAEGNLVVLAVRERGEQVTVLVREGPFWPAVEPLGEFYRHRVLRGSGGAPERLRFGRALDVVGLDATGERLILRTGEGVEGLALRALVGDGDGARVRLPVTSAFDIACVDGGHERVALMRTLAPGVDVQALDLRTGARRLHRDARPGMVSPDGRAIVLVEEEGMRRVLCVRDAVSGRHVGYGLGAGPLRGLGYGFAFVGLGLFCAAGLARGARRRLTLGVLTAGALVATLGATALHASRTMEAASGVLGWGSVVVLCLAAAVGRRGWLVGPWVGLAVAQAAVIAGLGVVEARVFWG